MKKKLHQKKKIHVPKKTPPLFLFLSRCLDIGNLCFVHVFFCSIPKTQIWSVFRAKPNLEISTSQNPVHINSPNILRYPEWVQLWHVDPSASACIRRRMEFGWKSDFLTLKKKRTRCPYSNPRMIDSQMYILQYDFYKDFNIISTSLAMVDVYFISFLRQRY